MPGLQNEEAKYAALRDVSFVDALRACRQWLVIRDSFIENSESSIAASVVGDWQRSRERCG